MPRRVTFTVELEEQRADNKYSWESLGEATLQASLELLNPTVAGAAVIRALSELMAAASAAKPDDSAPAVETELAGGATPSPDPNDLPF